MKQLLNCRCWYLFCHCFGFWLKSDAVCTYLVVAILLWWLILLVAILLVRSKWGVVMLLSIYTFRTKWGKSACAEGRDGAHLVYSSHRSSRWLAPLKGTFFYCFLPGFALCFDCFGLLLCNIQYNNQPLVTYGDFPRAGCVFNVALMQLLIIIFTFFMFFISHFNAVLMQILICSAHIQKHHKFTCFALILSLYFYLSIPMPRMWCYDVFACSLSSLLTLL